MNKFFRTAPLPATAFVTTIVFLGALAYFAYRIAEPLINGGFPNIFDLLAGILLAVLVGYALLRSVRGYTLAENEVIVDRRGPGKLHIAMDDIKSAEANPDLGVFIKSNPFSLQGLFGWSGNVDVRKHTDVQVRHAQVYGTNPSNMIVLELANGRTVILTPADTQGFAEALREAGIAGTPAPAPIPAGRYKQGARSKKKR